MRGGLKINLAVAVDLTDSNGVASCPTSLHHIHPDNGENAYTTAMHTVGEILQDYNYGEGVFKYYISMFSLVLQPTPLHSLLFK